MRNHQAMTKSNNASIDYKYEVMRKSIHLASLLIPSVYNFITVETALTILFPITILSLILDTGRFYFSFLEKFFNNTFGFLMREHEKDKTAKNLSGASYVFISAILSIAIFPKQIFLLAFPVLILSDTAAALLGRRFGKHKFLAKSLEGTLAFFVMGCLIVFVSPKLAGTSLEYFIAFVAVAIGAIVENISSGWADDNLTIPLSVGFVLWGLYLVFLPNLFSSLYSPFVQWILQ